MARPKRVFIVNELDILEGMLRNAVDDANLGFNEIVPHNDPDTPGGNQAATDHRITQLPPWTEEQLPSIYMAATDFNAKAWGEPIHRGLLTDSYVMTVQFEISIRRAQEIEYDGIKYSKSVQALRVIYDVLSAVFAFNIPYKKELTLGDRYGCFTIADVRGIGVGLRAGNENSPDAIDTLVATFQFDVEKSYEYMPGIPRP